MRTTITLDGDVELLLRNAMRERQLSFKDAVNQAIRAGLKSSNVKGKRFRQRTYALGARKEFNWDKALEMAAGIEDEELMRKLALRK